MGRAEDLFARLQQDGEAAVREFVAQRKSEEMFLDFKQAVTKGDSLDKSDRENYAKALSGFANSEGGVIVWGVDARRQEGAGDVAQLIVPVQNVPRFVSQLEGETSGATDPAVPHVRHIPVVTTGTDGFAVSYVRQSPHAPHRSPRDQRYYLRTGSSFGVVPHRVLRGMFGHPDAPVITHAFITGTGVKLIPMDTAVEAAQVYVFVQLRNEGPLPARDVYLTTTLVGDLWGGSTVKFSPEKAEGWETPVRDLSQAQMIMAEGRKLPPLSPIRLGALVFEFREPFESEIAVDVVYGHGTSPASQVPIRLDHRKIAVAFGALRGKMATGAQFGQVIREMLSPADE
jgi:schlafen family protein